MSNVFRRPMFRGGPMNMNGIMSGIKDRQNYQYGERVKEEYEGIKPVVEEVMGTYKKPSGFEDPVYQLAIQTGLDLMSKADGQSLLRNIGAAGARQTPQFFKNIAEERAKKRELETGVKSAALGLAGDIVGKQITAEGKPGFDEKIYETKVGQYLEQGFEPDVAKNAARFLTQDATELKAKVGNKRYGGVMEFDLSKPDQVKSNKQLLIDDLDGTYVYDPFEGNYKLIRYVDNQLMVDKFNSIDEIRIKTAGADIEKTPEVKDSTMFGMDIEDPIA
jgi:hypothetical protein